MCRAVRGVQSFVEFAAAFDSMEAFLGHPLRFWETGSALMSTEALQQRA